MGAALKPIADHREATADLRQTHKTFSPGLPVWDRLRMTGLEAQIATALQRWSTLVLRLTLGIVFLWFGALKVFGVSPAAQLVQQTYSFLPFRPFFMLLGFWEIAIGCGMITRLGLRLALVLLCLHLAGTFTALYLAPHLFFLGGNLACLSMEGEFVIKNLVLLAAGLVVAGYQLRVPEP